ncbi:uncharacterized protein LOC132958666 isoform X2 [Labrus mixtus]|uniref:uncharacterized protein LOC132958666 isoform X2 n=1 Tax=Labrus mixtus TaxID=508554 RepID=UPI0029C0B5FE|nr:uncharacterized protein LOC132958666 isoform X2 [Labrus mixtus]
MIKCWSHLCFLVLVISSLTRGQSDNNVTLHVEEATTTQMMIGDDSTNEASRQTPSSPFLSNTSVNETDQLLDNGKEISYGSGADRNDTNSTKEDPGSEGSQTTAPVSTTIWRKENGDVHPGVITTASTTEASSSPNPVYVILCLIILVIIVLCIILYLLRRVSRSYSFDLQRHVPPNRHNEPTGTFGQVYLDDLDLSDPKDEVISDDLSSAPVVNGTTLQLEDKISKGETAPEEKPDENGIETSPTSNTSSPLGDDQADNRSTNSTNLFFDAIMGEEQQNENNNNNPSVCSRDPFVEINLEEPALSDQLLTLPEGSSSPLSFSPFSFSSSSS